MEGTVEEGGKRTIEGRGEERRKEWREGDRLKGRKKVKMGGKGK